MDWEYFNSESPLLSVVLCFLIWGEFGRVKQGLRGESEREEDCKTNAVSMAEFQEDRGKLHCAYLQSRIVFPLKSLFINIVNQTPLISNQLNGF